LARRALDHVGGRRRHDDPGERPGRDRRHEGQGIGHGALGAVRRPVQQRHAAVARPPGDERRGAAAVEVDRFDNAQPDEDLGELRKRDADAVPRLPAVDDDDDDRAIGLDSDGRAGMALVG
jgi:hypothetical protein